MADDAYTAVMSRPMEDFIADIGGVPDLDLDGLTIHAVSWTGRDIVATLSGGDGGWTDQTTGEWVVITVVESFEWVARLADRPFNDWIRATLVSWSEAATPLRAVALPDVMVLHDGTIGVTLPRSTD